MKKKWLSVLMAAAMTMTTISPAVYAEDMSESLLEENNEEVMEQSNAELEEDDSDGVSEADDILTDDGTENEEEVLFDENTENEENEIVFDETEGLDTDSESETAGNEENSIDLLSAMQEEFAVSAYASSNVEDDAPWSSVDSLPAGTYENVTANLYVPGAQNKILGVNAYLNNPADPVGMSGVFGTPTAPMYNEASMVINENGKITLTVELKNQVFELLQVKDGKNIHVKEVERSDTWAYDNVDKVDMGDGTFKGRITKIVFELDDFSGLYTLGDCVEFGIILYDEQNPDKDVKWYVPLNLAVDFEEQKPDVNISNKVFFNDDAKVGIAARGRDMDKVTADIREITSGEEFEKVSAYMKENCAEQPNYKLYYFSLNRTDGKDISESKLKYSFFKSVFHEINDNSTQIYQWQGNSLSEMKVQGNTTREYWNGQEGDIWEAVTIYEGLKFGYVIICDKASDVKCQRTFTDEPTGISAIYHGFNNDDSCDENILSTNTEFAVRKNDVSNPDELKKMILESGQSSFKQLKIEDSYRIALYRRSGDSKTLGAQKNITYTDILFPENLVKNQDIYKVVYDRDVKQYVSVEKMKTTQNGENIYINAVDNKLSFGQQTKQMQLYYSAIDENYVGSRSKSQCQFFVFVGEGAAVDKPSVPTSAFTYDATEKVVVPESKYYTVEGTVSAKLPGSYKATVTLKDGYAWKDGTTDPIEIDWTIKALQTEKPSVVTGLTYNGKNQNGVLSGTGYNLAGTYAAKDAGSYNAKALLAEGYEWSDGTTDPLTLTWKIDKKKVAKPSAVKNLTYNEKAQMGVQNGEGYTVTGNVQTAPGTYTATATLDKNYAWTDGSNAAENISWSINKAEQNLNINTVSKSYKVSAVKKKAQTFTINAVGMGKITYKVTGTPSKKAAKYLTVNKNGKVTVKKGAPAGTYTITVSAAATDSYHAATSTVTVKVKKASQKVTAKVSSKTIKAKQIAKKNIAFSIGAKGKGKLSYKVTATPENAAKYISVSKKGKVTVKKAAPKGTYKITVTAAGDATYAEGNKTITVKVK